MSAAGNEPQGVDGQTLPESISGLRVAVTRSAARAGGLADALSAAGAVPILVPLIDFEMAESEALDAALEELCSGKFAWLVISSITTVRALKQWCQRGGTSLTELLPVSTRIATIGPISVAVLAAEGLSAELAPTDKQSAEGLVDLWPDAQSLKNSTGIRVLIPQSNLAGATLAAGIVSKGWDVETVTAYQNVDYPAAEQKRLTAVLASSDGAAANKYPLISPAQAALELHAGRIDGVVLASGSAARRVIATMAPLPESVLVIAIGEPTAQEANRLGLDVSATAKEPTPAGIVAALVQARAHNFNE